MPRGEIHRMNKFVNFAAPAPAEDYTRNATLIRVIDGDTIVVNLDLGHRLKWDDKEIRLLGLNCPEKKGKTRNAGLKAEAFTHNWFAVRVGQPITVRSHLIKDDSLGKEDSFGRLLYEVWAGAESLGAALLASGNAVPFMV